MIDEFLTRGLEGDRYLKALRMIEQFEKEIEAILLKFDQRMVDQHPDLFDPDTDPRTRTSHSSRNTLAHQRVNHSMSGPLAPSNDQNQKLNVHLYWMEPTEYNRTDIDGALRALGYKIKNADRDVDTKVVEQTRAQDWPLRTSKNPFDPNIVFYRHVSSAEEIKETIEILVEHFAQFGQEYADNRDQQ